MPFREPQRHGAAIVAVCFTVEDLAVVSPNVLLPSAGLDRVVLSNVREDRHRALTLYCDLYFRANLGWQVTSSQAATTRGPPNGNLLPRRWVWSTPEYLN